MKPMSSNCTEVNSQILQTTVYVFIAATHFFKKHTTQPPTIILTVVFWFQ